MGEGKLEARRPVGWPFQWSRQEIMRIWLKVVVGVKEMNLRHSEDNFSGKRHFLFWATFFYAFSVKESLNWKQTEMLGRCWGNHGLWCQTATAAAESLQSCPTLWPHRRQPTRLPRPWESPGKNTGVGCHFLLQCMEVKSESEVAQSCPTLSNPMDCSLPGSSIHGIFQARVLEWGAIAFSMDVKLK